MRGKTFVRAAGLSIFLAIFLLLPAVLFAEGQMEPSQAATINTLQQTCGQCHGGSTKYPVAGAELSYLYSGHNLGYEKEAPNSWYANGGGCQQCHTSEGFVQYVSTGKMSDYVSYPSQPGCFTCHDPHTTGDFSLRTSAPVKLPAGATFDGGKGNICANCHQGRTAATNDVKAGKMSVRLGPHHGPEADLFLGVNGYQTAGMRYSNSSHTVAVRDSCVQCHMALPDGRYGLTPAVSGHSFNIEGDVHGSTVLNTAACTSCHSGIGQDGSYFNIKAKADYDGDGTVEDSQAEVQGLLDLLVNTNGTGALQRTTPQAIRANGSINTTDTFPVAVVGAVWNYEFILADRSLGVHNTKYTVQLLMDSLKAVNPRFDASKRPM